MSHWFDFCITYAHDLTDLSVNRRAINMIIAVHAIASGGQIIQFVLTDSLMFGQNMHDSHLSVKHQVANLSVIFPFSNIVLIVFMSLEFVDELIWRSWTGYNSDIGYDDFDRYRQWMPVSLNRIEMIKYSGLIISICFIHTDTNPQPVLLSIPINFDWPWPFLK